MTDGCEKERRVIALMLEVANSYVDEGIVLEKDDDRRYELIQIVTVYNSLINNLATIFKHTKDFNSIINDPVAVRCRNFERRRI